MCISLEIKRIRAFTKVFVNWQRLIQQIWQGRDQNVVSRPVFARKENMVRLIISENYVDDVGCQSDYTRRICVSKHFSDKTLASSDLEGLWY